MSYPPNQYGEQDDSTLDGPGPSGSRSPVPSIAGLNEQDEDELNAVRRYEDFTTVGM